MNENVNGVRKVDVFNDIVSRLEDSKKARVSEDVVSGMKNYYNNKQDYRERVGLLADNLKGVKPIDNQVNNVIYLSNFVEKGIAIKTSIISFKQIWIEYRLIFNENNVKKEEVPVFSAPMNNNVEDNKQSDLNNDTNLNMDSFSQFEVPKFDVDLGFDNSASDANENVNSNSFDQFASNDISNNDFNQVLNDNNGNSNNFDQFMNNDISSNKSEFSLPNFNMISDNQENNINNDMNFNNFKSNGVSENKFEFNMPSVNNLNLETNSDVLTDNKLDDNYKKLYNKVINLSKYIEQFNNRKLELDRQIAVLEDKKKSLSSELRDLEIAKKEFSKYKLEEEKKINDMKNEVNSKVVSLQNLIDNLDSILGNIN